MQRRRGEGAPVVQGWMMKKCALAVDVGSAQERVQTDWRLRWVHVENGCLWWYVSDRSNAPKGKLLIAGAEVQFLGEGGSGGKRHAVRLELSNKRGSHTFACYSSEDAQTWSRAMQRHATLSASLLGVDAAAFDRDVEDTYVPDAEPGTLGYAEMEAETVEGTEEPEEVHDANLSLPLVPDADESAEAVSLGGMPRMGDADNTPGTEQQQTMVVENGVCFASMQVHLRNVPHSLRVSYLDDVGLLAEEFVQKHRLKAAVQERLESELVRTQLEASKAQITRCNKQLAKLRRQITFHNKWELRARKAELHASQLETHLRGIESAIPDLDRAMASAEERICAKDDDLKDMTEQVSRMDAELSASRSERRQLGAEIHRLQSLSKDRADKIFQLETRLSEIDIGKRRSESDKVLDLIRKLRTAEETLRDTSRDKRQLEDDIADLRTQHQRKVAECDSLTEQVAALERRTTVPVIPRGGTIKDTAQFRELQSDLESAQSALQVEKTRKSSLDQQLSTMRTNAGRAASSLKRYEEEIARLRAECKRQREALDSGAGPGMGGPHAGQDVGRLSEETRALRKELVESKGELLKRRAALENTVSITAEACAKLRQLQDALDTQTEEVREALSAPLMSVWNAVQDAVDQAAVGADPATPTSASGPGAALGSARLAPPLQTTTSSSRSPPPPSPPPAAAGAGAGAAASAAAAAQPPAAPAPTGDGAANGEAEEGFLPAEAHDLDPVLQRHIAELSPILRDRIVDSIYRRYAVLPQNLMAAQSKGSTLMLANHSYHQQPQQHQQQQQQSRKRNASPSAVVPAIVLSKFRRFVREFQLTTPRAFVMADADVIFKACCKDRAATNGAGVTKSMDRQQFNASLSMIAMRMYAPMVEKTTGTLVSLLNDDERAAAQAAVDEVLFKERLIPRANDLNIVPWTTVYLEETWLSADDQSVRDELTAQLPFLTRVFLNYTVQHSQSRLSHAAHAGSGSTVATNQALVSHYMDFKGFSRFAHDFSLCPYLVDVGRLYQLFCEIIVRDVGSSVGMPEDSLGASSMHLAVEPGSHIVPLGRHEQYVSPPAAGVFNLAEFVEACACLAMQGFENESMLDRYRELFVWFDRSGGTVRMEATQKEGQQQQQQQQAMPRGVSPVSIPAR